MHLRTTHATNGKIFMSKFNRIPNWISVVGAIALSAVFAASFGMTVYGKEIDNIIEIPGKTYSGYKFILNLGNISKAYGVRFFDIGVYNDRDYTIYRAYTDCGNKKSDYVEYVLSHKLEGGKLVTVTELVESDSDASMALIKTVCEHK